VSQLRVSSSQSLRFDINSNACKMPRRPLLERPSSENERGPERGPEEDFPFVCHLMSPTLQLPLSLSPSVSLSPLSNLDIPKTARFLFVYIFLSKELDVLFVYESFAHLSGISRIFDE